MRAIAPNLRRVFHDGSDAPGREALMLGATLAGIAFSNASVALVHGMSRPYRGAFPCATRPLQRHAAAGGDGLVGAGGTAPLCDSARAMGVAGEGEGDQSAVARLLDELSALNAELEVPSPRAYGIDEGKWLSLLPTMAAQALASGSPANNPRVPVREEIVALYHQAWG